MKLKTRGKTMSDNKSDGFKAIEAAMKELDDAFPGQFERGEIIEVDLSQPFRRDGKFDEKIKQLVAQYKKGEKP